MSQQPYKCFIRLLLGKQMRRQIRSIMCGCGECATRPNVNDRCAMGTSKEAIQLWHSDPDDTTMTEESIIDQVAEIIEEVTREPQEMDYGT